MKIPELETKRLSLVPLTLAHSVGMHELWSNSQVCEFSGSATDPNGDPITLPARTRSDSDKLIALFLNLQRLDIGFRWAVILKSTDSFIGTVGFNSLGRCSELAYHQHPKHWGMGFMTEACREAILWVQSRLESERVDAYIEPDNQSSVILAERLGFKRLPEVRKGADRYILDLADYPSCEQIEGDNAIYAPGQERLTKNKSN